MTIRGQRKPRPRYRHAVVVQSDKTYGHMNAGLLIGMNTAASAHVFETMASALDHVAGSLVEDAIPVPQLIVVTLPVNMKGEDVRRMAFLRRIMKDTRWEFVRPRSGNHLKSEPPKEDDQSMSPTLPFCLTDR